MGLLVDNESNSTTVSKGYSSGSGFQDVQDVNSVDVAGVEIGYSPGASLTFNQTDHGAIGRGLQLTDKVVDYAFQETEANRQLLAGAATALLDEVEANRLYHAQLVGAIGNAAVMEIDKNRDFTAQTLRFVDDNFRRTQEEAFSFAGDAVTRAFSGIEDAQHRSFSLLGEGYSKFIDSLQSDTAASYEFIDRSQERTFGVIDAGIGNLLEQSRTLLNGLSTFTADIVTQQGAQNAATVAAVSEATRSDAAQSFDKLIKYAAWAVGAIALGSVLARKYA